MNLSTSKEPEKEPRWVALDKWRGFPSAHFKVDFLAWLAWMDNMQHVRFVIGEENSEQDLERINAIREARLARMTLVTALMIESCYYFSECAPPMPRTEDVRSKCMGFVMRGEDLTALTYDMMLFDCFRKVQGGGAG